MLPTLGWRACQHASSCVGGAAGPAFPQPACKLTLLATIPLVLVSPPARACLRVARLPACLLAVRLPACLLGALRACFSRPSLAQRASPGDGLRRRCPVAQDHSGAVVHPIIACHSCHGCSPHGHDGCSSLPKREQKLGGQAAAELPAPLWPVRAGRAPRSAGERMPQSDTLGGCPPITLAFPLTSRACVQLAAGLFAATSRCVTAKGVAEHWASLLQDTIQTCLHVRLLLLSLLLPTAVVDLIRAMPVQN